MTPIQLVSSLQQIVLNILSNDCVANLTCGVLGTQIDTPGQLAIGTCSEGDFYLGLHLITLSHTIVLTLGNGHETHKSTFTFEA